MSGIETDLDALDGQVATLEDTVAQARSVTAAFQNELQDVRKSMAAAGAQADGLSRSIGWGLRRAFDGLVFDGARLSDALATVGRSMVNAAYGQAIRPVQNALGGMLSDGIQALVGSMLPYRNGAAFSAGRVMPFARGGVVSQATAFPMRGATGLMGEAGPEAIMPLARGADGRLGIQATGTRSINVTMNITTPDLAGFRRSRSQVAAEIGRAIARGSRNE
jgi:phage-related minor tail protein